MSGLAAGLAPAPGEQRLSGIVGAKSSAIVAWTDARKAYFIAGSGPDLYAGSIDRDGVMTAKGAVVARGVADAKLVTTDTGAVVLYPAPKRIRMQLLDASATPRGPAIDTAILDGRILDAASNGVNILVVVGSGTGVTAWVLDKAGKKIASYPLPASLVDDSAAIVAAGTTYHVVHAVATCKAGTTCRGTIADLVIDKSAKTTTVGTDVLRPLRTAAAAGSGRLLVAWLSDVPNAAGSERRVEYTVIGDGGPSAIRTATGFPVSKRIGGVSAGWDGARFAIGWEAVDVAAKNSQIEALAITDAGEPVTPKPVALGHGGAGAPDFAQFDGRVAIAWDDVSSNGESDPRAAVVPDFRSLSAIAGNEMYAAEAAPFQRDASMTSFGSGSLVTWRELDRARIYYSVLSQFDRVPEGAMVAPEGEFGNRAPAVAESAESALIAWIEDGASESRIKARSIGKNGLLFYEKPLTIHTETRIGTAPPAQRVSISSDGTRFLVAWIGGDGEVRASRIAQETKPIDTAPIAVSRPSAVRVSRSWPRALWNGSDWIVLWIETTGNSAKVYGANVTAEGASTQPRVLVAAPGGEDLVTATRGSDSLVAWVSGGCVRGGLLRRDGTMTSAADLHCVAAAKNLAITSLAASQTADGFAVTWSERGKAASVVKAKLLSAGALPAGDPWTVSPAGQWSDNAMVAEQNGQTLFGYVRLADDATYGGVTRVFVRTPKKQE